MRYGAGVKLTLRELFWLLLVVACLCAWWVDHAQLNREINVLRNPPLPPIAGRIESADGPLITFTIGAKDGVKEGMVFDLARDEEKLGEILVFRTDQDSAFGIFLRPVRDIDKIEPGDAVTVNQEKSAKSREVQLDAGAVWDYMISPDEPNANNSEIISDLEAVFGIKRKQGKKTDAPASAADK